MRSSCLDQSSWFHRDKFPCCYILVDHRGAAVAYHHEQLVEIALGPKEAFENGNIRARVP